MENEFKCGYNHADETRFNEHKIDKRSTTKKVHGVYQQNTQTRFVELLIVNDHKLVRYFCSSFVLIHDQWSSFEM